MKTNVVMQSEKSRELFGVIIRQNTKDSMLSLSDLQEAYIHARVLNGWSERGKIQDILAQKENIERVYYVLLEQGLLNDTYDIFLKNIDNKGIIKYLKEKKLYMTTGRGSSKSVWCHRSIWFLCALELSTLFFAKVIQYSEENNFFQEYHNGRAEFVSEDRKNHEKAWKFFYPEGNGKPKDGYVLHHINPEWRYKDIERYSQWNVEDLQMMTKSEHLSLHKKLGFEYILDDREKQLLEACDLNNNLRRAVCAKIDNPDYAGINRALNVKIFGYHQTGMRNLASEADLQRLNKLQENIAFCIERDFLKSNADIIREISKDNR